MRFHRSLRQELQAYYKETAGILANFLEQAKQQPWLLEQAAKRLSKSTSIVRNAADYLKIITNEYTEMTVLSSSLPGAQTIVFSAEQANVFADTPQHYFGALDFRLPFQSVFLQFTEPVPVQCNQMTDELLGIYLYQCEVDATMLDEIRLGRTKLGLNPKGPYTYEPDTIATAMFPIFSDRQIRGLSWASNHEEFFQKADETTTGEWAHIKNIAIACVGFINAENITLQRCGDAPDRINQKRLRQGKKQLEPYYVCTIRGVHYSPDGDPIASADPSGRHVSFRFDVRGHFRRLVNGKVTWVRPHQRGLFNELYIPKTYKLAE